MKIARPDAVIYDAPRLRQYKKYRIAQCLLRKRSPAEAKLMMISGRSTVRFVNA